MSIFTCMTCQSTMDEEMGKHLADTRHKTVRFNRTDEIIECEECGDSNINQLTLARFGLSDMALLCQSCLSKEIKPATQYSLSNGSLFKKLEQYYTFRDLECINCGADENLNVKRGKPSVVLCLDCLGKSSENAKDFVNEDDETFLGELFGIKEFTPKNSKSRGANKRKGKKRGKVGKARGPKKVDPEAERRKAHYENSQALSKAFKSGTTVMAVGSETQSKGSTPVPDTKNKNQLGKSRESTPKSRTPSKSTTPKPSKPNGKANQNDKKKEKPQQGKLDSVKDDSKRKPDQNGKAKKSNGPPAHEKRPDDKKGKTPEKAPKETPKEKVSKDKSGSRANEKSKDFIDKTKPKEKLKDAKSEKSKSKEKSKEPNPKSNEKTKDGSKRTAKEQSQAKGKGADTSSNSKNKKLNEDTKKKDEKVEPDFQLPANISKFTPSTEAKLTYDSFEEYFKEMSYNLYFEEKYGNIAAHQNLYIESSEMILEWFAEQDKKHKQYKVSVPMDEQFTKRFLSPKMLSFKKAIFSANQTVFLVLNDEVFWPGQIVTSDTKSLSKGKKKNGPKALEMIVVLYDWNDQPLPTNVNVKHLKLLPASIPVSRVFMAMTKIKQSKFAKAIMGKEPIKHINFKNFVRYSRDTLNDSQKVAVQSVLNNAFTVLKGPPGTGKTSTIYEIILQLLENLNTYPLLVVAASNIAIDNIAEKLMDKHERSIIRIASNEKEKEYNRDHPLASICLHHKVYDALPLSMKQVVDDLKFHGGRNTSQNQYKKLLATQIPLANTFIAQARVIFSTTVVAGGNQLKSVAKMPVVIMDEATQSTEPTTLIPMSMTGVDKFVLVGDQKQLSSFTQVPQLSLSFFERVLLNGSYKQPHMLDTQYRMHPAISEFPRARFYDGLLKDGIEEKDRYFEGIKNPVYFWDTAGSMRESQVRVSFREDKGSTYINRGEIARVITVLTDLIYNKKVTKTSIGVVTPYRGQRDEISAQLAQNDLINPEKEEIQEDSDRDDVNSAPKSGTVQIVSGIMVASIDAFQGREKDFVIMSCVRSNDSNKVGFLSDQRRLNVALTRARYGLVLIGDVSCLSEGSPLWKEYIDSAREKGSVSSSEVFDY